MYAKFGVKTDDLEEARIWVIAATGLRAEPRESSNWGGDYYAYHGSAGEKLRLISNRDVYDGEPIVGGCDEWKIVLTVEVEGDSSNVLTSLERGDKHFVMVAAS